ncbi:SDR family oxidoreductase [Glaciihabitans sp. GrIS 2.15]|uniref:SDR family oxidoreductase n=1 Tax=Glaciihabitans sp. GrIS 2.15 TaxID=3071710 RepID=UPI002DF967F5|nr:3-oxoacyl-[acyl-carrier protein] reductase [Glaciihabitans sp. GrIS 2.15]
MPLALVTGSARENSIAAGVVPRLRADGWHVVTCDLENADYLFDLSTAAGPAALIEAVMRDEGPISALVLSHAHDVESGVLDTTAESFDHHIAVNARASLLLIAAFARQIPEAGGAVVALTSDATTGNLPYGASKGALDRIVISAARELGPMRISANVLNPGPIDTGWMDESTRQELTPRHPSGRLGQPADIASVVAFLVSSEGRWISGQLLNADGGFSARF